MKKNTLVITVLIVLIAAAIWVINSNGKSTIKGAASDFAIEDTGSITKVFLARRNGENVTLERQASGDWKVNNQALARQDAIDNLLETVNRLAVKGPVSKSSYNTILENLATEGIKVEVYQNGDDEASKVFYVGSSDQFHSGTYMMIEGSSAPFLMHIEGFYGFLTPRFFTNPKEWRSTGIFNYSYGEIQSISVERHEEPAESFKIGIVGDGEFNLTDSKGAVVNGIDPAKVLGYASLYRKVHFEGYEETKDAQFIDSVKTSPPLVTYSVTDVTGRTREIKTWLKPMPPGTEDFEGNAIPFDVDRMYGLVDDSDFVVIQYHVFDPLNKGLSDFKQD